MGRCLAKRWRVVAVMAAETSRCSNNRIIMPECGRCPSRCRRVAILTGVAGAEMRAGLAGGRQMGRSIVVAGKTRGWVGCIRVDEQRRLERRRVMAIITIVVGGEMVGRIRLALRSRRSRMAGDTVTYKSAVIRLGTGDPCRRRVAS